MISIIENAKDIYQNLPTSALMQLAISRGEGDLSKDGALVVKTGKYTGRIPDDKYIVIDDQTESLADWDSHKKFYSDDFDRLYGRMQAFLLNKEIFVQDIYAGSTNKLPFTILTTKAWHSLFVDTMFNLKEHDENSTSFLLVHAPDFKADPKLDKTASEAFIIINFSKKIILIGGTSYAGEIKKAIFTVLNFILPTLGVLPMHASVNVDQQGIPSIFFGLSGTGKTTLSADPNYILIGDDEHGWSDDGLYNFENGCYAKTLKLSQSGEPYIWNAVHSFGTLLENVILNYETRNVELYNDSLTENTRAAYKLNKIPNAAPGALARHPANIIMLTCDAYGVLPPVSKLTNDQAIYYFLSGYTAKVAGTERGLKQPVATFSACFGAPFIPMNPTIYSQMLEDKIINYGVDVYLVNTGWIGGPYGIGNRIGLKHTRKIIENILNGSLLNLDDWVEHHIFKLKMPAKINGVPDDLLMPQKQWLDAKAYDAAAQDLMEKFKNNFKKYEKLVASRVKLSGP